MFHRPPKIGLGWVAFSPLEQRGGEKLNPGTNWDDPARRAALLITRILNSDPRVKYAVHTLNQVEVVFSLDGIEEEVFAVRGHFSFEVKEEKGSV